MYVGTVIGSASWAMAEPAEGSLHFSTSMLRLPKPRKQYDSYQ